MPTRWLWATSPWLRVGAAVAALALPLALLAGLATAVAPAAVAPAAGAADLRVTVSLTPAYAVQPGERVTATVAYANLGSAPAADLLLTVTLPAALDAVAAQTPPGWSPVPGNEAAWQRPWLEPGASGAIVVSGRLAAAAPPGGRLWLPVEATVQAAAPDANPPDNRHTTAAWGLYPPVLEWSGGGSTFVEQGETLSLTWRAGAAPCCLQAQLTTVTSVSGQDAAAVTGRDGLPLLTYHNAIFSALWAVYCHNPACTLSTRTELDRGDSFNSLVGAHSSVAVGRDGLPIISYHHGESGALRVAHCQNVRCTAADVRDVVAGYAGAPSAIAIGRDGRPLIAYFDGERGALAVAHCADAGCRSAVTRTVDDTGWVGEQIALALGADGLPLIAYYDATRGDLKLARCGDEGCATVQRRVIDAAGRVGQFPSLAIGADGLPLIAYYDATNGDLKLARCLDADCATAVLRAVETAGDTGQFASLAVGADGLPLIAYRRRTANQLALARCHDAACSAATAAALDGGGTPSVGQYAALTVGGDGAPFVAYLRSGTLNDLRAVYGRTDLAAVQWEWGDGSAVDALLLTRTVPLARAHSFAAPGYYTTTAALGTAPPTAVQTAWAVAAEWGDLDGYPAAWHAPGTLWLGPTVDYEVLQPPPDGDGSDDGVFFGGGRWEPGAPVALTVVVNGAGVGRIAVWFDWNGDRQFEPAELGISQMVGAGVHILSALAPPDYRGGKQVGVRVRLYDGRSDAAIAPGGRGGGGEVEDYLRSEPTALAMRAMRAEGAWAPRPLAIAALLALTTAVCLAQGKRP